MAVKSSSSLLWVLLWTLLALVLRLSFLTLKPIWMDEVATVMFTLGNSSYAMPLDQVISLDQLLLPLTPDPAATVADAVGYLLKEDNHPPAYFALAHGWMDWFAPVNGVASLWAARALPAICGALAVPLVYLAARFSFNPTAGQIAAALMAVSPFGVALSQEARHYGLATLLVAACLACFAVGTRALWQRQSLSGGFCLLWVGVNGLAFATHYFAALTLLAEGLVVLGLGWVQLRREPKALGQGSWLQLYGVLIGTAATCLIWLPVLLNFYGSSQSSGIALDYGQFMHWINPIFQMLAGLILMVLTPVTVTTQPWMIALIVVTAVSMLWVLGLLVRMLRRSGQLQWREERFGLVVMGGFVGAAVVLFFAVTYGAGMDITRGHRYNFVFHSGVMVLLGGLLAPYWSRRGLWGRRGVQIIGVTSLVSGLLVVGNLAFGKYYNPDRFIPWVQANSEYPALIGFPTQVEDQPTVIGHELLSIAWQMKRQFNPDDSVSGWETPPRFFLLTLPEAPQMPSEVKLSRILASMPAPFDLWFINTGLDLSGDGCTKLAEEPKGGHMHSHYRCGEA